MLADVIRWVIVMLVTLGVIFVIVGMATDNEDQK